MELPKTFSMHVAGGKTTEIPSVGFGTWASEDPSWCEQAVVDALQVGVRHLDCAWEYGVDEEVGRGIKRSGVPRREIFVTSKFWPQFAAPENVEICLDQILERMRLDYIDLFLAHFPAALKPEGDLRTARNFLGATSEDQRCATDGNGSYVPDLEHCPSAVAALNGGKGSFVPTWNAMKELVRVGKCRAVGLSNFEREHIEEILPYASRDDVPISCNQIEAHPWYPNTELIDYMKAHKIVPLIYSPFAPRRFKVEDGEVIGELFMPDGTVLLKEPAIQEIARKLDMDAGQVLQSWAVQRGTVPLGKSSSRDRIASNLMIKRLPEAEVAFLNALKKEGLRGKSTNVNVLYPGLVLHQD